MKSQRITNGPKLFLKMTNRLRDLRLDRNMTQVAFAAELKMPRGSYSLLESGVMLPTSRTLSNLTHALTCSDIEIYAGVFLDIIKMESNND